MPCFCCRSVAQSCPTLCDPMNCSTPGFPVLHHLPELAQAHVHWVGDAIQPSHPLSSPCPPALNLSQHQGLFQWVSSLRQVAKILELLHQSSNEYSGLISLRMHWFDLRAVQGTLKSLLQHHSSCFRAWLFPYYHIKGFEMSCSGETCVIPLNLAPPKLVGPRNPLFRPAALHNLHNQWFTDPSLGSAGPHATATSWELSAALTRGCIRTPDGIFLDASCSRKWTWAHRESAPPGPLPQS